MEAGIPASDGFPQNVSPRGDKNIRETAKCCALLALAGPTEAEAEAVACIVVAGGFRIRNKKVAERGQKIAFL